MGERWKMLGLHAEMSSAWSQRINVLFQLWVWVPGSDCTLTKSWDDTEIWGSNSVTCAVCKVIFFYYFSLSCHKHDYSLFVLIWHFINRNDSKNNQNFLISFPTWSRFLKRGKVKNLNFPEWMLEWSKQEMTSQTSPVTHLQIHKK